MEDGWVKEVLEVDLNVEEKRLEEDKGGLLVGKGKEME